MALQIRLSLSPPEIPAFAVMTYLHAALAPSTPLRTTHQTPSACDEIAVDKSFTLLAPIRSSGTKAGGGAEGVTLVVVGTRSGAHMLRSGFGSVLWISGTSRNEPAASLPKRLRWGEPTGTNWEQGVE